jgi:hypothetical protein
MLRETTTGGPGAYGAGLEAWGRGGFTGCTSGFGSPPGPATSLGDFVKTLIGGPPRYQSLASADLNVHRAGSIASTCSPEVGEPQDRMALKVHSARAVRHTLGVSLSRRIFAPAALAAGVGLVVPACSAASARPPVNGDCVKVGDAGCSTPDPGGGAGSGPTTLADSGSPAPAETGSSCGVAEGLFTTNTSCLPCIEGQTAGDLGCCQADEACSEQAPCFALLQCVLACPANDSTCAATCENSNPNGVQAYDDLSACLTLECSPQCPTLPQGGTADF